MKEVKSENSSFVSASSFKSDESDSSSDRDASIKRIRKFGLQEKVKEKPLVDYKDLIKEDDSDAGRLD